MRSNPERMERIRRRTAQLQRRHRERQQRGIDAACVAACLVLVVWIGVLMPGWAADGSIGTVLPAAGTASLIGSSTALGYILMGILSFCLGVCVTVLLYRLRGADERRRQDEPDDED